MSQYSFGYILLGVALVVLIVMSYAKRKLFEHKVGLAFDRLDSLEVRLKFEFRGMAWQTSPCREFAALAEARLKQAREDLSSAMNSCFTGQNAAIWLKEARVGENWLTNLIGSGVLSLAETTAWVSAKQIEQYHVELLRLRSSAIEGNIRDGDLREAIVALTAPAKTRFDADDFNPFDAATAIGRLTEGVRKAAAKISMADSRAEDKRRHLPN